MTLLGALAPFVPQLELLNHFRALTLLGCISALCLAVVVRHRAAAVALAALVAVNGSVIAAATGYAARSIETDSRHQLKLVTFNVLSANAHLADAARWIISQDPDIVVLQEMTDRSKPQLVPLLASHFPHLFDCRCNDIVIASKRPWIGSGGHARTASTPSWSWIDLKGDHGTAMRIVSLRPYYPYRPSEQARQYEWIERELSQVPRPLVVIGDFNLTPWSWKLLRLSHRLKLVRHGTWKRSWPAQDNYLNIPAFLIDNVLTSPDIRSVAFDTGPWLGSDHLPVVATVEIP